MIGRTHKKGNRKQCLITYDKSSNSLEEISSYTRYMVQCSDFEMYVHGRHIPIADQDLLIVA